MARYLLGQSLAHIKLFIAATICVKEAQNTDIWRLTGPGKSLEEFVTAQNSNCSQLFRVVNGFIILFQQVYQKQAQYRKELGVI